MNSMTGYSTVTGNLAHSDLSIELKSVNHRYLETKFRLPSPLSVLEIPLGQLLKKHFARGSFEINIRMAPSIQGIQQTRFAVDEAAAKSFLTACTAIGKTLGTKMEPTLEAMARTGKIIVPIEEGVDTSTLIPDVEKVFLQAIEKLKTARNAEGKALLKILQLGSKDLSELTKKVEALEPLQAESIQKSMKEKIAGWELPGQIDATRLEHEIAFLADKSDFREELDRFKLHIADFDKKLESTGEIGRSLDFLIQEMHRELNTMGSKAGLIEITQAVIAAKGVLEKLRQQVQNVE